MSRFSLVLVVSIVTSPAWAGDPVTDKKLDQLIVAMTNVTNKIDGMDQRIGSLDRRLTALEQKGSGSSPAAYASKIQPTSSYQTVSTSSKLQSTPSYQTTYSKPSSAVYQRPTQSSTSSTYKKDCGCGCGGAKYSSSYGSGYQRVNNTSSSRSGGGYSGGYGGGYSSSYCSPTYVFVPVCYGYYYYDPCDDY